MKKIQKKHLSFLNELARENPLIDTYEAAYLLSIKFKIPLSVADDAVNNYISQ